MPYSAAKPKEKVVPYSPLKIAQTLKDAGVNFNKILGQDIKTHWMYSLETESEVIVWMDSKNRLIKIKISYWGGVVEWSLSRGLRTGIVVESEIIESPSEDGTPQLPMSNLDEGIVSVSEEIQYDSALNSASVEFSRAVISHSPCIESLIKKNILFKLYPRKKEESFLRIWLSKILRLTR